MFHVFLKLPIEILNMCITHLVTDYCCLDLIFGDTKLLEFACRFNLRTVCLVCVEFADRCCGWRDTLFFDPISACHNIHC